MGQPDLVVVRTYLNRFDAELAHSALEAADIDSMIDADGSSGTQPGLWLGGVKLLVRAEDAEQAAEILGPTA
jgi:putative signal transducing protein